MKKLKRHLVLSVFFALGSFASAHEDNRGFYLSGVGSVDFAEAGKSNRDQNDGRGGSLALGYFFQGPLRAEAEIGFHTFENSRFFPPNVTAVPGWTGVDTGKSKHLSLMANVFYDVPLNDRWDLNLGVGAGMMRFSGDRFHEVIIFIFPPVSYLAHYDNIDRLAVQALGGLTFHVNPRFALTARFRLAAAREASFQGVPINTGTFSSVELGIRMKL